LISSFALAPPTQRPSTEIQRTSPAPARTQQLGLCAVSSESILPMKRPREFSVKECIRKVKKTEQGIQRLEATLVRCKTLVKKRCFRLWRL
jgi:hypothetical protein